MGKRRVCLWRILLLSWLQLPCLLILSTLASVFPNVQAVPQVKSREVNAVKGTFVAHMLHSAYLFPHTVDVTWSATAQGKPSLPVWLHLYSSKHKSIAYLIGTPVTPLNQITIHVMARREDTFAVAEQFIVFKLKDDPRYNTSTQQTIEFLVKNADPEEFINSRNGKVQRLERAVRETFRGKLVNPYIFDIRSELTTDPDKLLPSYIKNRRFGSIVKVGTQKKFHANVKKLIDELQENPSYCNRSAMIPLNKHFQPEFDVNWCTFKLRNVTMIKSLTKLDRQRYDKPNRAAIRKTAEEKSVMKTYMYEESNMAPSHPYPFWESVLIFPLMAVLCILLMLLLSLIFFGRREGQHWRDYKTPKEQLQEYLSLRESQKHLRELSVQRQILLMNSDQGKPSTPVGIRTFLQPNRESSKPKVEPPQILFDGSTGRASVTSLGHEVENKPLISPRSSIAKQTVADAVKATGSSLHLYRNPVDESDDDKESENEELKQRPRSKSGSRRNLS